MPRRGKAPHRLVIADAKYNSRNVTRIVSRIMYDGKRSLAERIVYDALDLIEQRAHRNPLDVFEQAIKNATPAIEVKPRRVGGATYQVPVEVRPERRQALAIRWLVNEARKRNENTMQERLAGELIDASNNRGAAVKKREETHRMAEANRAFSHYRW